MVDIQGVLRVVCMVSGWEVRMMSLLFKFFVPGPVEGFSLQRESFFLLPLLRLGGAGHRFL